MPRNAPVLTSAIAVFAATVALARVGPDRQQPPNPTPGQGRAGAGVIAGQVIDAASNQPATGALVQLTGRGVPLQRVLVDPQGRYVFRALPPGVFAVSAGRLGFLGGGAGVRDPL